MYINIDLDQFTGKDILTTTFAEDRAVISIIRGALKDAKDGGHPDPKAVWADIAATLRITI